MTEIRRINASRPRTGVYSLLARIPGAHLIFVGALSCLRHRNMEMINQQQNGRLSLLLMEDVDFVTGRYLDKIKDACRHVAQTKKPEAIILLTGCQSVLLSTDYGMICTGMEAELGIPVRANECCYLCGFDSAEDVAKADTIEHLLFEFIKPRPKASEPTVNILACLPLAPECELRGLLERAGVKVNELSSMTSWEEYQQMGAAQLNIICTTYPETLGQRLRARLGIPYVVLTDEYSPAGIAAIYDKIGQVLGISPDYAEYKAAADEKFTAFCRQYATAPIEVNGSMKAAKWLLEAGLNVTAVTNNSRSIITKDLNAWFRDNAPGVELKEFSYSGRGLEDEAARIDAGGTPERGFGGRGGRPERGGHGGRPDMRGGRDGHGGRGGRPEGRGGGHGGRGGFGGRGKHGGGVLVVGFAATDAALREDNFGRRWH